MHVSKKRINRNNYKKKKSVKTFDIMIPCINNSLTGIFLMVDTKKTNVICGYRENKKPFYSVYILIRQNVYPTKKFKTVSPPPPSNTAITFSIFVACHFHDTMSAYKSLAPELSTHCLVFERTPSCSAENEL